MYICHVRALRLNGMCGGGGGTKIPHLTAEMCVEWQKRSEMCSQILSFISFFPCALSYSLPCAFPACQEKEEKQR